MLEPRGHADMYGAHPHRAGLARIPRRRAVHAQRGLQHDVRPRRDRGDDDRARARAAMPGGDGAADRLRLARRNHTGSGAGTGRWGRWGDRDGRRRLFASRAWRSSTCRRSCCTAGSTVKLGVAADSRRRRLRRRVLRHRRQRGGRPADRCGAPARTAAGRHGDQARDRGRSTRSRIRSSRACAGSTARSSPDRRATSAPTCRNVTIFADAEVDRSPCGTGTAAVMAVVDAMGLLSDDRPFVHESLIGTRFNGRVVSRTEVGELPGDRAGDRRVGLDHRRAHVPRRRRRSVEEGSGLRRS